MRDKGERRCNKGWKECVAEEGKNLRILVRKKC